MVNLELIGTFVRVVEEGGLSGAARVLGVPKSTVSRRLARLEEMLGTRLVQRTSRSIRLTEAGQSLHAQVANPIGAVEDAARRVHGEHEQPAGRIRMTAPVDVSVAVLPDWLGEFCTRYPAIDVEIEATAEVVDLVQGAFDLAVRAGMLPDSSLVARKLLTVRLGIYCAREYARHHGTPGSVRGLASHPAVLFRAQGMRQRWRLQAEQEVAEVELHGRMLSNDFLMNRRLLATGVGVGLLPTFMGDADVSRGELVRVLPEWSIPGGALHVVCPTTEHLPYRVRLLRQFLIEKGRAWGQSDSS